MTVAPSNNALANLAPAHHGCHAAYHVGAREAERREQLEVKRRSRQPRYRETFEMAAGIARQIEALAKRTRTEDPDGLLLLLVLEEKLADAFRVTVDGLRDSGFRDREIGEQLGTSRQAVEQRWPRRSS